MTFSPIAQLRAHVAQLDMVSRAIDDAITAGESAERFVALKEQRAAAEVGLRVDLRAFLAAGVLMDTPRNRVPRIV